MFPTPSHAARNEPPDPALPFPRFVSLGEALTDLIRDPHQPEQWTSKPGGAPWNVARVLAGFGVSSAFAGAISNDVFGDAIWRASVQCGLDPRFEQRVAKSPLLAIVDSFDPVHYFFIGDDSADLHFDPALLPQHWQQHAAWAHFGGISLVREPLASRLITLARSSKAAGLRISFDPNFRVLMDERYDRNLRVMVELADVIKVSDEDLRGLFRTENLELALRTLRTWNPHALLLFTRGAEGATLFLQDRSWSARPPPIKVVDTIGAGDASMGGLLYSLMQSPHADPAHHLQFAVASAASACQVAGAGTPTLQQVKDLVQNITVRGPDQVQGTMLGSLPASTLVSCDASLTAMLLALRE